MALHGRLCAADDAPPRPGFLVSLRDVKLHAATLDGSEAALTVMARRILGDARGASYEFNVSASGKHWRRDGNGSVRGPGMKRALVTGASGTIGAAIAHYLAACGHHVYLHANAQLERAKALAAEFAKEGRSAQAVRFDITNAEETGAALEGILEAGPSRFSSTMPGSMTTR